MTTIFEPRLIGRNQEVIDANLETWRYAIQVFNELATDWNQTATKISKMWGTPINAKFDIPLFRQLLQEKYGNIEKFIKVYFINADPEYAKFSKRIKIEETLKQTEFPDISGLMATLQKVKEFAIKKITPVVFETYIHQIWNGNVFAICTEIIEEIEKEFTFYTENIRENLVFEIATQLANSLNLLNSLGASILPRDLPPVIEELITCSNTSKRNNELNHYFGEGNYLIQKIIPGHRIKSNISVYTLIKNLSEKEVLELYQQLTGTKNNLK